MKKIIIEERCDAVGGHKVPAQDFLFQETKSVQICKVIEPGNMLNVLFEVSLQG
jgi:hypothetical protein